MEGTMLEKMQRTSPYNLFFTTISNSPETSLEDNCITFRDLLCPSLGALQSSLQINFNINIRWLLNEYETRNLHQKPLTILYDVVSKPNIEEFSNSNTAYPNLNCHPVQMNNRYGSHHSKIGIYAYEDGSIRIVVSTANLFYDWDKYNQGLWVSPKLKKLPQGSTVIDGESPTGFKSDLLDYLSSYNMSWVLRQWVDYVRSADFSEVKVAFVYSTPGRHGPNLNGNHLYRVRELLGNFCVLPKKTESEDPSLSWKVIAQASSIGSLGNTSKWLDALLSSLASHQRQSIANNSQLPPLCLVYPSHTNVANGYSGLWSGGCLIYSKTTHERQVWLQAYMHQWIADGTHRTRAMPHIKSYCRVSPDSNKLAYFLLTSANLSKAAWGDTIQRDHLSYVRSFEAGVMFLPTFFGEDFFEIKRTRENADRTLFPFMFDLPLTPYTEDDTPYYNPVNTHGPWDIPF